MKREERLILLGNKDNWRDAMKTLASIGGISTMPDMLSDDVFSDRTVAFILFVDDRCNKDVMFCDTEFLDVANGDVIMNYDTFRKYAPAKVRDEVHVKGKIYRSYKEEISEEEDGSFRFKIVDMKFSDGEIWYSGLTPKRRKATFCASEVIFTDIRTPVSREDDNAFFLNPVKCEKEEIKLKDEKLLSEALASKKRFVEFLQDFIVKAGKTMEKYNNLIDKFEQ